MNIIEALQQLNYAVNRAHNKFITSCPGLMLVYQEKAEQAADYVAAKYPKNLSGYPLIVAEMKATKKSAKEIANSIIDKRAEWIVISAKIEEIRLTAKREIYESKTGNMDKLLKQVVKKLNDIQY